MAYDGDDGQSKGSVGPGLALLVVLTLAAVLLAGVALVVRGPGELGSGTFRPAPKYVGKSAHGGKLK